MAIKRKNIKRVINALKNFRGMKFNMNWYMTQNERNEWSACVGGFSFYASELRFLNPGESQFDAREKARKFLGLSSEEATKLFVPFGYSFQDIRRKHAIRVLKHLRKTGNIDWSVSGLAR